MRRRHGPAVACLLLAVCSLGPEDSTAQGVRIFGRQRVAGEDAAEAEDYSGRFRPDRESNQRLAKAQDLLAEKRWAEAIGFLEIVLRADEDFWFQPERTNDAIHRSVKHMAREMIGKMPREGRDSYELQCGAMARQMLDEALKTGDRKKIEEVHRRFFHTQAGYEATHRLGMYDLDHGHPLPAALLFERLRETPVGEQLEPMLSMKLAVSWQRAGMPEKARDALLSLKQRFPQGSLMLAGKTVKLFENEALALDWLRGSIGSQDQHLPTGADEVAMFRGNPSRNAFSLGGAPLLNARWRIPTANEKRDFEDLVKQQSQQFADVNVTGLPALHPLAVRLDLHDASQLRGGQIRDWHGLIQKLAGNPEPGQKLPGVNLPAVKILSLLSQELQTELKDLAANVPNLGQAFAALAEGQHVELVLGQRITRLQTRLVDELNAAFGRRDFYDAQVWAAAPELLQKAFRTEAADWLKRDPGSLSDDELFRLNRCLFDAAFRVDETVTRSYADVVLMRTYNNLLAVDFVTGKRVWEISTKDEDDPLERMLKGPVGANGNRSIEIGNGLRQRLWEDTTFGTLASDGKYVYSIEDLTLRTNSQVQNGIRVVNFNGGPEVSGAPDYNRLTAHDIRTGKLMWEVGGAKADELELAGMFFLGPPLPLDGLLYVLAEAQNEVRLAVLNPKDGTLEWSQTLYLVDRPVMQDALRPLAGVSPSYADGMLVCPTAAGAVVAVDLTSRSLSWGYRYKSALPEGGIQRQVFQSAMLPAISEHWADSLATISGGHLVLTPAESDEIHCVNLVSGSLIWKKKRASGLYVGGIYDGNVIVVGRRQVQALRLADGEPAWKTDSTTIPAPSGRGFMCDNLYYVPTGENGGEVVAIDLAGSGRIVSRSRSRSEYVPGNLICFRGAVISQGVLQLESFHELSGLEKEIATDLARNPDDPIALGKRGEVLAQRGQIKNAIEHLKRSLELKDDQQTRQLLVDTLLEGLRVDFAGNRGAVGEIEKLVEQLPAGSDPALESKARFLRLLALGLHAAGERDAAFSTYLKFVTPSLADAELERIEGTWMVQRHRWVQGQLNDLWNEADAEQRAKMDREIQDRLSAARNERDPLALKRFLLYFGSHPLAHDAREQLAVELIGKRQWLEAEMLLRRLESSGQEDLVRKAAARLAGMLVEAKRPGDAAIYYRQLATRYADAICLDGKTGKQLVSELAADSPVRVHLANVSPWLTGRVVVEQQAQAAGNRFSYQFPVRLTGETGPFFLDKSVVLDQQQFLIGRNELGAEEWKVNLPMNDRRNQVNPAVANQARVTGHLVLVARGQRVYAVDTLGGADNQQPRVLWDQSLIDSPAGVNQVMFQQVNRNGRWQVMATDVYGHPIGPIGPANGQYASLLRRRKLIAVDPLSGKDLWVRNDVTANSELFGDEEVLIAVGQDSTEALILRALDGKKLGTRVIPPADQRVAIRGRMILSSTVDGTKQIIKLTDPWQQKEIWKREFAKGTRTAMADLEQVGILEPEGGFVLLDVADGRERIKSKITPEPNMSEMHLLASRDRCILITSQPVQNNNNRLVVTAVNGGMDSPIIHGHVHLFDRTSGERIASTLVERQVIALNQPSGLPVLAFACRVYDQRGGNNNQNPFSMLFLDKRNGQIVHNQPTNLQLNGMDLEGDPKNNQIRVKLPQGGMTIKFTSDPVPAPPEKGK